MTYSLTALLALFLFSHLSPTGSSPQHLDPRSAPDDHGLRNPQRPQASGNVRPPPLIEPDDEPDVNRGGSQPSKCTWAIVACCSPYSTKVRHRCFETLGCPGVFFGDSPCSPKVVTAASKAVTDFYRDNPIPSGNPNSPNADD